MLNWVIVVVLVILFILFFRVKHFQQRVFLLFLIVTVLFFYITISSVVDKNNISLSNFDGVVALGKIYGNWLLHLGQNTKVLVGNAIKMDWKGNSSLSFPNRSQI